MPTRSMVVDFIACSEISKPMPHEGMRWLLSLRLNPPNKNMAGNPSDRETIGAA